MSTEKIEKLAGRSNNLKRRWPAHSVPPAMMEQLDDLEEELKKELDSDSCFGDQKKDDMETNNSEITVTINKLSRTLVVHAEESLLEALRRYSYFSVKYGCDDGDPAVYVHSA